MTGLSSWSSSVLSRTAASVASVTGHSSDVVIWSLRTRAILVGLALVDAGAVSLSFTAAGSAFLAVISAFARPAFVFPSPSTLAYSFLNLAFGIIEVPCFVLRQPGPLQASSSDDAADAC